MNVYIVTDSEAGWDCVEGAYSTVELAEQYCRNRDPDWDSNARLIIHEVRLI